MFLWYKEDWMKLYADANVRRGLRVRYDKDIDLDLKESIKRFILWLRKNFYFPFRVVVYVKSSKYIIAMDKTAVSGTILQPYDRFEEPYIRVAAGDYDENLIRWGRDNAIAATLRTIAHELSHYFQWINEVEKTDRGIEMQASICAKMIINEYAMSTEHP